MKTRARAHQSPRNQPSLPPSARASRGQLSPHPQNIWPRCPRGLLPCLGALPHVGAVGKGSDLLPHAWSPAQRNEWCSTLQKKVTDQRLVGSRPRPANTAHCQKSGTLELKGQKSKVFAALSLPEMWLYKSEQVRGRTRRPAGMEAVPMVDGGERDGGSSAGVGAKGRVERKRTGRRKGMGEWEGGDAAQGSCGGSLGLET